MTTALGAAASGGKLTGAARDSHLSAIEKRIDEATRKVDEAAPGSREQAAATAERTSAMADKSAFFRAENPPFVDEAAEAARNALIDEALEGLPFDNYIAELEAELDRGDIPARQREALLAAKSNAFELHQRGEWKPPKE